MKRYIRSSIEQSNNINDAYTVSDEIHKAISGDPSAIQSLKKQGYKVRKLVNPLQSAEVGTFEIVDPTTGKTYNYDNSVSYYSKTRVTSSTRFNEFDNGRVSSTNVPEAQNMGVDEIKTKIWNAASAKMEDMGFPVDEIPDYLFVEVKQSDDRIRVEVRAELSYDELTKLTHELDPIVQSFDKDAYFEPVEPGIAEAYIWNISGITSSTNVPEVQNSDDALWDVIDDEEFEFRGVQDVGYDDDNNIVVVFNHAINEDMIELVAEELLAAFRQYGYPVHDWNTNGSNVYILTP